MGILGFLLGLGCLVVIAWAIALLGDLVFGRKHRQQNRPQKQPLPKPTQFRERFGSSQPTIATPPTPTPPRRKVVAPQEQPSPKPTQFRERFGSPQPPIAAPQQQPSPKPTQFRERFGSPQPPIAAPQEQPLPKPTQFRERFGSPQPPIAAPQEQPLPKPTQFRERFGSPQPPITAPSTLRVPRRQVVTLRQPPVSSRVDLKSSRHQQYIQLAALVLEQLRSGDVQLPKALGILRQMNPYAFEELLLTCCHERDWKIKRNFKYSNDGGLDGHVTITGKLYLIQAKRYRGYIKAKHIHDFHRVIQGKKAAGGFFIHTGRTSKLSNQLLQDYRISLLSGQSLVDFVLGQGLKVVG